VVAAPGLPSLEARPPVTGYSTRAAPGLPWQEAVTAQPARTRDRMLQLPAGTSSSRPENRSGRV